MIAEFQRRRGALAYASSEQHGSAVVSGWFGATNPYLDVLDEPLQERHEMLGFANIPRDGLLEKVFR